MQTTLQIGGKSIRLDHFEPKSAAHTQTPAILLLHGAGGNADYWLDRLTPVIVQADIAVYAVHYFDRTNTVRADMQTLSDGVHVPLWLATVRDTLAHIARQPHVDPQRIALVGISLGAFLSLALATLPDTPYLKAIVEISGGLVDPYAAAATAAFPPTLILHGDADTIVPVAGAHALEARLTQLKVPHEIEILKGEGHWFAEYAQQRIFAAVATFLSQRL